MTNEPPTIADHAEFRRLLHAGHGRVITFLQTHDSKPYHDIILDACLHHPVYDKQFEHRRGTYTLDLIQTTHNFAAYRRHVLDALRNEPEGWDGIHLCSIARSLAETVDREARLALYEYVTESLEDGDWAGADELIEMDGVEGFYFVANILGKRALQEPDFTDDDQYWSLLEEYHGKEAIEDVSSKAASANDCVKAYLRVVDAAVQRRAEYQERIERSKRGYDIYEPEPYDEIRTLINAPIDASVRLRLRRWGRKAIQDDLVRAANDLLNTNDSEQLLKYLNIFRYRVFPLDPQPLIMLTEHEDKAILEATYAALEGIEHPAIRAHALQLFAASRRPGDAVELLQSNFEKGDQALIEHVLRQPLSDDDIHSVGIGVKHVIGDEPLIEDVRMLMLLYERDPCSYCRERIVELLVELDQVPEWMRAECRYDANLDIRAMIEEKYGDVDHLPEHREL